VDQHEMSATFADPAAARTSFVTNELAWWYGADALLPCAGLDAEARLLQAVEMLRGGGYTWEQEPSRGAAGRGLTRPDGVQLAPVHALAPADDESRTTAAAYVAEKSAMLGLPTSVQAVTQDTIDYAVLSSGDFEMAVMGWRLSPYPTYLCGWFGPAGPFHYDPTSLTSLCGELAATSDLESARPLLHEVQQVLAADVPMLPLYSTLIHEDLNDVTYPFSTLLDGLAGAYGAPEWAIPTAP
jgi:ABC-type transport system substrate-binding protein